MQLLACVCISIKGIFAFGEALEQSYLHEFSMTRFFSSHKIRVLRGLSVNLSESSYFTEQTRFDISNPEWTLRSTHRMRDCFFIVSSLRS